MENKNNKGIVIALLIVILVLIGSIIYMFTSKNFNNSIKENKGDNANIEELELDSSIVEKLYSYINDGTETMNYFYSKDLLTNKTIDNEIKLKIAVNVNGIDMYEFSHMNDKGEEVYSVNSNVVLNQINEIFGEENGYKYIDSKVTIPYYNAEISYDENTGNYELIYVFYDGSSPDVLTSEVFSKLVKAVKTDDTIVLTEKMYVHNYKDGKVYKDFAQTKLIANDSTTSWEEDKYFNKGATVTYTFKLDENNNYYFDNSKISY